jgi:PIN domain nuclease of toxin-antitoxin system
MNLLIDTHVVIWWADGRAIAEQAAAALRSPDNTIFVSAVSVWEAEIKIAIGKLELGFELETACLEHGFEQLPVTFAHAARAGRLPGHHRDPRDRMLVAQAQLEGLTLVTRDPAFRPYRIPLLAA